MTPQHSPSSAMPLPAPWKEVVHPSSGATYYWNTVTSETTWIRPHDVGDHVDASTSVLSPGVGSDSDARSVSERVDTWRDSYDSCKDVHERLSVFFRGLPLIRACVEEQNEIYHREQRQRAELVDDLIANALRALDGILQVASAGTKSYSKFAGYKHHLQQQKHLICSTGSIAKDRAELLRDVCEEVLNVYENLKSLSEPTKPDAPSHVASLCGDYQLYMKRKKTSERRSRWESFKQSSRNAHTFEESSSMRAMATISQSHVATPSASDAACSKDNNPTGSAPVTDKRATKW